MQSTDESRQSSGVRSSITLRALLAYRRCDKVSGLLIYFLVIFSPWAFGSVRPWGIWTVNVTCYVLGLLLLCKWCIRMKHQYEPERWVPPSGKSTASRRLTLTLLLLTLALLAYCAIAAINARASYDRLKMVFEYHEAVSWLPQSYDSSRSWDAFFKYLALACFFWSLRDWLLGRSPDEARAARAAEHSSSASRFPERLKRLLMALSVNTALIGVEGIIQRLSGTPKPLWLLEMKINRDAINQFGPWGYRANAAQYFNLVWPVTLGLWWTLIREARRRSPSRADARRHKPHWLLLPVAVIAACPVITASRGGAFVTFGCLAISAFIMVTAMRNRHASVKFAVLLLFGTLLSLGLYFGWDQLGERLADTRGGFVGREALSDTARLMARDYPLYGIGPGAFEPVFQLYRSSQDEYWPAQLHNDWLETLVTFGWFGSAMIGLALVVAAVRWLVPGNPRVDWRFGALTCVALAGGLAHARFDYPMQVYSILLLFVMLCGILFSVSRRVG